MKKLITIALCIILFTSGCAIKENKLVIIENANKNKHNTGTIENWQFEIASQKNIIDKNKEILKKIDTDLLPIIISPDYSTIFAVKSIIDYKSDEINSKVISGNMIQPMELYSIKSSSGNQKNMGKFLSIKSYSFSEDGKQLAFIDGEDNVYIYNLDSEQLQKVLTKYKYRDFYSISWSRDGKRLLFDSRMIFDIASKEFISIAADSYTPFIKKQYNENTYIVEMKNDKYDNIVALYDFDDRSYTQVADGLYMDSDNTNILYTLDYFQGLKTVNLKTLESKEIEIAPVFCANILKSTGEIIYTTVNPHFEDDDRYLLIVLNPETMSRKVQRICTPTYYLSPAEDLIYFTSNYGENEIKYNLLNYTLEKDIVKQDEINLSNIKSVLLKMFQLDYNFSGTYEEYEREARKIYTNTSLPVPQEALNNKLTDYKRFNMPLPSAQKEPYIPPILTLDSVNIRNNYASINIGRFFINSIELIKVEDKWYIAGFSTHPESKEISEIRTIVINHINDILSGNDTKALSIWPKTEDEFNKNNRQIIKSLINSKNKITIEIGETELWSLSDPHRAESPSAATEARVKITIKNEENINKYKIILSKQYQNAFSIISWDADPLSISQLY